MSGIMDPVRRLDIFTGCRFVNTALCRQWLWILFFLCVAFGTLYLVCQFDCCQEGMFQPSFGFFIHLYHPVSIQGAPPCDGL